MRTYCVSQATRVSALGDLNEKETQKRGDTCKHIAESLCCTIEANTTL